MVKVLTTKQDKNGLEKLLDLPRADLDWGPKAKLAAGFRIWEYALDYRARELENAWGQWWKTNSEFG